MTSNKIVKNFKTMQKYATRVGLRLGKLITPPLIIIGAIMAIFTSEKSYHQCLEKQENLEKDLIQITDINATPKKDYEGKTVYVKGPIHSDRIEDGTIPLVFKGLVLSRKVELYKKIRYEKREDYIDNQGNKQTKYIDAYRCKWVTVPSTRDEDLDALAYDIRDKYLTPETRLKSDDFLSYYRFAKNLSIGNYPLSDELSMQLVKALKNQMIAPPLPDSIIPEEWSNVAFLNVNTLYLRATHDVYAAGGPLSPENVKNPQEGDVKMSWEISTPNLDASVIALYKDSVLGSHLSEEIDSSAHPNSPEAFFEAIANIAKKELSTIVLGEKTPKELIEASPASTSSFFERNRIFFMFVMMGFAMLFTSPIQLLAKIPMLAPFLQIGKVLAAVVGLIFGAVTCAFVISIVMMIYQPLWGILLFMGCLLVVFLTVKMVRKIAKV